MVPSSHSSSLFYVASRSPEAAWVFSWTQPINDRLAGHSGQAHSCKAIDKPKGNVSNWDADGGNVGIYLYATTDCAGPSAGHRCKPWPLNNHTTESQIFLYEDVNNMITASSVASTTCSLRLLRRLPPRQARQRQPHLIVSRRVLRRVKHAMAPFCPVAQLPTSWSVCWLQAPSPGFLFFFSWPCGSTVLLRIQKQR